MKRRDSGDQAAVVRPSPFGPVAVVWSTAGDEPKVVRVLLSRPGRSAEDLAGGIFPCGRSSGVPRIDALADDIQAFLSGSDVRFPLSAVRLGLCSGFQQKVLLAEYSIPRGMVRTYADIARQVDRPSAFRAVGNALARNPFPLVIPCHRAVRSDGSLGGFQGGMAMKRRLLEMEGVEFTRQGKVVLMEERRAASSGGIRI